MRSREQMNLAEWIFFLFQAIREKARLLLIFWIISLTVGSFLIFSIPRQYLTLATLIPLEKKGSPLSGLSSSLLDTFSSTQPGMSNSDILINFLKSETIRKNILLENEDILAIFLKGKELPPNIKEQDNWNTFLLPLAAQNLGNRVRVISRNKGPIEISSRSRDPEMNLKVIEAYLSALLKMSREQTTSQATIKRITTRKLLDERKDEVQRVHRRLLSFDESGNMRNLSPAIIPTLEALSEIAREQASFEMYLEFLKTHAPTSERELNKVQNQINNLIKRREKVVTNLEINWGKSGGAETRSLNRIPVLTIEYLNLKARAEALDEAVLTLSKELELALVEEASEQVSFQVLDHPVASRIPVYPPRGLLLVILAIVATFLSSLIALFLKRHAIK